MIYSDILKQANTHRGAKIDDVLAKWYINEALQDLAVKYDTACKRTAATVVCPAGVWVDLPAGCIRIVDVSPAEFYEASLGQIRTETDTTLTITYLTRGVNVVNNTDAPDVHELYHLPLALFMAGRDRQRVFADEESDAQRLMGEFYRMAADINARLMGLKGTRRTLKAGAFR